MSKTRNFLQYSQYLLRNFANLKSVTPIVAIAIFTLVTNTASSQTDQLKFEDRLLGIRFDYPSFWKERISTDISLFYNSKSSQSTLEFVPKETSGCKEGAISCYYVPGINIKIFEVTSPDKFLTLDDYAKEQIRIIQNELSGISGLSNGKNYELIELNRTNLAGKPAIMHIFSYTSTLLNYPDSEKNQLIELDLYMVNTESMNNQKRYHIEYLGTKGEEYSRYLSSMKQVMSTFELIPLIG